MKGEIIFCAIPDCPAHLVCPPDQGPSTWVCPFHEQDAVDQYWNTRQQTHTHSTVR